MMQTLTLGRLAAYAAAFAASAATLCAGPDFERDVLPVFAKSCVSCHGPQKERGGFRADNRDAVISSGDQGPWVVPGDAGASKLADLLSGMRKTERAADKHILPASQVDLIRRWIDAGAP